MNGGTVFDAKAFLAKAGVGKKILSLKKNDTAYVQGDPADAIFYVQKGRLRVTVTSSERKRSNDHLGWSRGIPGGELHGFSPSGSTRDGHRDDRVCTTQD